jgi:hypothetical protein
MDRACSIYQGDRNSYKILVGKYERKKTLGIFRLKQKDNIKQDQNAAGYEVDEWIHTVRLEFRTIATG